MLNRVAIMHDDVVNVRLGAAHKLSFLQQLQHDAVKKRGVVLQTERSLLEAVKRAVPPKRNEVPCHSREAAGKTYGACQFC